MTHKHKYKQHIVITGGAGFIGSHIASRVLSEGCAVTVLDNLSTGKKETIPKGANFIEMDLGLKKSYVYLENINCDAVFHLAGQSSGEASFADPFNDLRSHVLGTFFLLDWCKKKGIQRFLYASSMSVYGEPDYLPLDEIHPLRPKSFYGAGKTSAEAYIKLYQTLGINITIFRLFSVYGPGQNLKNRMQGMASIYLSYMLEGVPVIVKGSGERFRDFIYIDDVVDIWVLSLDKPVTYGKVYNLASGRKTKVKDLLNALRNSFRNADYPIEYRGGTLGDQIGALADTALIKNDLRWSPKVDLQTGLNKTVDFEKELLKNAQ